MLEHALTSFSYFSYLFLISMANAGGFVFFIHQYLRSRYPWWVSLFVFTCIVFGVTLFRDIMPPALRVGFLTPLFFALFSTLLFRGTFKRKLVIAGVCYLCGLAIESITAVILFLLQIDYQQVISSRFFDIFYSGIIVPSFFILLALMLRPVLQADHKFSPKDDNAISLMVFTAGIAIGLFLCFVVVLPLQNAMTFIIACLNVVLTTGSLLLTFYLLSQMEAVMEDEKEQALLRQSYELSLIRTRQAVTYRREIDTLQAGMKTILDDILHRLSADDIPGALAIIRRNRETAQNIKPSKRYQNRIADYLIAKADRQCAEEQIAFAVDYALPAKISMDEMDFCVVLANILDNAVQACQTLQGERLIHLTLHQNDNILFIGCQNTRSAAKKDAKPYRRLGSFGLRNIKETVEKYHGDVQINQDDKNFSITALLYCGG